MIVFQDGNAQQREQKIYKVLGISVEGNTAGGTDATAIITHSGLSVGDEVTIPGNQFRNAINRLLALRIFSDVQILSDKKLDNGMYLVIKVKEYSRLTRVEILGSDDLDEDEIRKKFTFTEGQYVTPSEVHKAMQKIKEYYFSEGYLLTKVSSESVVEDSTKSNYIVVKFTIDEGPEVMLGSIEFEGNEAFDDGELEGEMEDTEEKVWWQFWSSPQFDSVKYKEDKKRILSFYRKSGYLDAEILSDSVWYSEDKERVNLNIRVHEGPQYRIRSITWDGATVYPVEMLNERLEMKKGDIFDDERFEQNLRGNQNLNDVSSMYRDQGYLTMELDPEIKRIEGDSVDIAIQVVERNQFKVGKVEVRGNTKTHDYVIRRELYVKPGEYYSQQKIVRSIRQLQQLNYFNMEKLGKGPELSPVDDQTVNVVFDLEEKSSDNVNASIGYSQVFGVTGALGFTINNFSIKEPLSGGAGQVFNFEWQFGEGQRYRTFSFGFTEPWLYGSPTTLGINLYDTRQSYFLDIQQTGLSVRFGRRLKWPDDYFRADWTLRFQNNNVRDNGGIYYYQTGVTQQYSISQSISRNSIDNPIFPSLGSSVSLSIEMAGGPLLPGNVDYHKWQFQGDWYTPLFGSGKLVLASLTSLGFVSGFEDNSVIPPLEYFWMGGSGLGTVATTPLRGYEDRAIGPKSDAGTELGGKVMTKQTIELRLAVTLEPIPIYLLAFAEGGNVFTDFAHADLFDLKRSYGIGARLLMNPLGLIGFDYGYGIDDVSGGQYGFPDGTPDGWQFHFQFGRGF